MDIILAKNQKITILHDAINELRGGRKSFICTAILHALKDNSIIPIDDVCDPFDFIPEVLNYMPIDEALVKPKGSDHKYGIWFPEGEINSRVAVLEQTILDIDITVVKSVDEITKPNIKYAHTSNFIQKKK